MSGVDTSGHREQQDARTTSADITLPDPEVLVAHPVQQDVPVHNEWVATLDGYVNAEIRPQVSGYIISQNYKEGTAVRKGQVLFEIDPRPFQAALDPARGQLAQAEAALAKSAPRRRTRHAARRQEGRSKGEAGLRDPGQACRRGRGRIGQGGGGTRRARSRVDQGDVARRRRRRDRCKSRSAIWWARTPT